MLWNVVEVSTKRAQRQLLFGKAWGTPYEGALTV